MPDRDAELDLPAPLHDAMQKLYASPVVPPMIDDRILVSAKEAFVRRHRTRLMIRGALAGVASSAAVVGLAFWMAHQKAMQPAAPQVVATAPPSPDDVDGSGHVDILDAYIVSRTLATHGPLDPRWDRNGDGKVDAADVDSIAQAAVTLPVSPTRGVLQ